MRRITRLVISALRVAAGFASGVMTGQRVAFGLSTTQTTNLSTAVDNFDAAINDVAAAKAAYHSAVTTQSEARKAVLDALSSCAATMFNNPAVTDAMIESTGLEPRDFTPTKLSPHTPVDLIATPQTNGNVGLKWGKGLNEYGAVYIVETRHGEGDWTFAGQTTKTKFTATGFEPGGLAWFRVSASRNGITSDPTGDVVVYAPAPGAPLMEAA